MVGMRRRGTTAGLARVVAMCGLLVVLSALAAKDAVSDSAAKEPYLVGVDAFDEGAYETALKAFRPLSDEGDFRAQIYLGTIYEKGLGLDADLAAAAGWYRRAANGALGAFYRERKRADEWQANAQSREGVVQALEDRIRELQQTLDNIRRQLPGNGGVRPTTPQ